MGLRDAAARGRRIREERERAERATAELDSRVVVDERRLARVYGVDPDGRGFAIYLGIMSVVLALVGAGAAWWTGGSSAAPAVAACAGSVALWAVGAFALDARARRAMISAQARLREVPFVFDVDDYERVASEYDHSTGWARVSIQFDEATLAIHAGLRGEITDAMTAFGAEATRWVTPTRLWIRSASSPTAVSTENADYTTARALGEWIERLVSHDLRDLHVSAPIVNVSVRFGFFEDGSFTVDDENEHEHSNDY